MFKSLYCYTRSVLLVPMVTILLAGCAEIRSGMNDMRDGIVGLAEQVTEEKGEANAQATPLRQQQADGQEQQKTALKCPNINIIDELGTVHKFTDMNPPAEDKRIGSARLISLKHECRITDQDKGQVDLHMTFESSTGPALGDKQREKQEAHYPYFVAVTDQKGKILAKDIFKLAITPSSNTDVVTARETIRQIIPVDTPEELADYNIAIGFQMSDAQLKYNRKHGFDKNDIDKPESIAPENRNKPSEEAHRQIRNLRQ